MSGNGPSRSRVLPPESRTATVRDAGGMARPERRSCRHEGATDRCRAL
ncbi:hypothetical protein SCATT_40370 [Streptantibioticus cattleyicolor NRRL 8057 = DSM 46488]|uniref:Uncharacterized protein n=1 Tax=Streptantibioticus cattleyicolor (strain ATCC 35852 / DSM 46488 / JCM 4925 / NBRC 14057 / NRRL 8057) TaxID=1003195 RepID=G8WX98_STREN|nr:hypothetical protein SCATT_40370 [Streptantibioticus cattleyicolor NRRL 8057 = DSM 46488]